MKQSPATPKTTAKSPPKTMSKVMSKAIAEDIAIVPIEDGPLAECTAVHPAPFPVASAVSPELRRAAKTRGPAKSAAVSLRQVWAMQQQKTQLQTQIEQFNQQHLNQQPVTRQPVVQPRLHQAPLRSKCPSGLATEPTALIDPWEPTPDRGPLVPEPAAISAASIPLEDAQACLEISNALRALAGRQALAKIQSNPPLKAPARRVASGRAAPASLAQPTARPTARPCPTHPHPLKSGLRTVLRWQFRLVRRFLRIPRTRQGHLWNGAVWLAIAVVMRWVSKLILMAMPGLATVMGIGVVLSTIAVIYLALQPRFGPVVLCRLLLILLGFWLGGRF